jgi:Cdc6-like AAA superfamily ATPase
MAVSLANLKKVRSVAPPRTLIYGPPGLGKTTLASEFPAPVFIQIEDGTPANLELDSFGILSTYDDVMSAVGALYAEDHAFNTVAIDSLDKFEPIVWQAVCEANKWENIESPGYGKGYTAADSFWRDFLGGLNALRNDRGMTIALIAHSDVGRFDDPRTASYSRFDIRLHKRALAIVEDEMDLMIFLNQEATVKEENLGFNKKRQHAEGGIQRWMYVEGRPSLNAKNRYGMPPKFPYKKGEGFNVLAPYLPHMNGGAQPTQVAAE